jgi:hypothetical protein
MEEFKEWMVNFTLFAGIGVAIVSFLMFLLWIVWITNQL